MRLASYFATTVYYEYKTVTSYWNVVQVLGEGGHIEKGYLFTSKIIYAPGRKDDHFPGFPIPHAYIAHALVSAIAYRVQVPARGISASSVTPVTGLGHLAPRVY